MLNRHVKRNKPLRTKASIFGFAFALFGMVLAASSAAIFDRGAKRLDAEPTTSYDFENEDPELLSADAVAAAIKKVSTTETSTSLAVTFSSSIRIYNNGRYNNVYVKVEDDKFTEEEAKAESQRRADICANPQPGEEDYEYEIPTYNASVFKISYANTGGNKNPAHIVIPEWINFLKTTITYSAKGDEPEKQVESFKFRLHVTGIGSGVPFTSNTTMETNWGRIESVTIPSSVETIESEAFPGAAENNIQFYFTDTAEEVDQKERDPNWTDAPDSAIHYGRTFEEGVAYEELGGSETANTNLTHPINTNYTDIGKGENYLLSCYPNKEGYEKYRKPLVIEYKYLNGNGDSLFYEVPLVNKTNYYDGVGSTIGSTSLTINVDIPKTPDVEIDYENVIFHNIHLAVQNVETKGFLPNLEQPSRKLAPKVLVDSPNKFADMISSFEPSGISVLGDYTMLKVRFHFNAEAFKNLNAKSYANHEQSIKDGTVSVRFQLTSLPAAKYAITYKGANDVIKTSEVAVTTPMSVVSLENGGEFGFMVENHLVGDDFKPENMNIVELKGFTLHLDLYNHDKNNVTNNSKVNVRFASLKIYDRSVNNVSVFSIPVAFVIAFAIYIVVFAGIAIGLYLLRKHLYKNDEFRRVNTKKYVIEAIKNFIGFAIVLAAILFIVGRWGWLDNGVVVFNPLDPGVIICTILGGIFIGFTIRNLVVAFKVRRDRAQKLRLKLDADVAEDGTN